MNPIWMILASLAAVAVLAVVFALQQVVKRRRTARGPMPPLCTTDEHVTQAMPTQVLSRDSLVNPNRTLNVHAWDNTPDAELSVDLDGVYNPDAEPLVLDRDFLANRARQGGEEG